MSLYVKDVKLTEVTATGAGNWDLDSTKVTLAGLPLAEGMNWIQVRTTDATTSTTTFSKTIIFTVDTTAPVKPTVSAPTAGQRVRRDSLIFRGTAEVGTTVKLKLAPAATPNTPTDIGEVISGTGNAWTFAPPTTLSLPEGGYNLTVSSIDGAQNSTVSDVLSFTVDDTPPDTTIGSKPDPFVNQTTASFTFAASPSESGTTFECLRNTDPQFQPCTSPKSYSGLAARVYVFYVRAKDSAGNVDPTPAIYQWEVDTTAPDAPTVTVPVTNTSVATRLPTISGTAEPGSTVTVTQTAPTSAPLGTAVAGADMKWSRTVATALTDGATYTVSATATDKAGNVSPASVSSSFKVDVTPPETVLVSGPRAVEQLDIAQFEFSSPETGATFECGLDGAEYATCTSPKDVTGLSEGLHTFRIRARDLAGNLDLSPVAWTWIVDKSPLSTLITLKPPLRTNQQTGTFNFESNKPDVTYHCSLDSPTPANPTFVDCATPYITPVLASKLHTLLVRARDSAGNVDPTPESYSWTVDAIAPAQPTVTSPAEGSSVSRTTPTLNGKAEVQPEGPVDVQVSVDGSAMGTVKANAAGDWTFTPASALSQGPHAVFVVAVDVAGNASVASATRNFTVDSTVPGTELVNTPAPLTQQPVATFTFTSEEAGVEFDCRLFRNGSPEPVFASCQSPYTSASLADGTYTFSVRARDRADNVDPTPALFVWTVDATAPDTRIDSGPTPASGGTTNSSEARFTFGSNELNVTFLCDLNGLGYSACPINHLLTNLATGSYTLSVKAQDPAGNVDASAAVWSWSVNTDIPNTIMVCDPTRALLNTFENTFTFKSDKGNDPTITFQCSLNQSTFEPCVSDFSLTVARDGNHTLRVKARDSLGNEDPIPAECTWTVDTQSPDTVLDQHPAAFEPKSLARFTFGFKSPEPGGHFECSLGAGPFTACTSPFELTDLTDAAYTLSIRAVDAAGNPDGSPATSSWVVDTVAPPVPVMTAPAPGAILAMTTPVLEGSGEPGSNVVVVLRNGPVLGAALVDPSGHWSLTPELSLPEGDNSLLIRAMDPAGNESETTGEFAITVDTRAPETGIVAGPDGRVRTTTTTFQFSSSEDGATFECSLDNVEFAACEPEISFDVLEGAHSLQVRSRDRAGNVDASPETRSWRLSLGSDTRALGGGVSCSSSSGGSLPFGMLMGLVGLGLMAVRRRRA
ncbi:Ig-like domain-containing protein [Corallococcus sp. CA053C]|uniref:Ig-like domain-containing protein n=1 Tax=Corallococcus sp. CA053C TaxID=2316732 RepID=UPI0011C3FE3D|nr:Ig-like domain-containing protein [Corallococcus sp. CA053C]